MNVRAREGFVGVVCGDRRFAEHAQSIAEKLPVGERYYAIPGCGYSSRHDKRVATQAQLEARFGGPAQHVGYSNGNIGA